MSEIAMSATELGSMSSGTFRNAVKQPVKTIINSLPETDGLVDTSSLRLVASDVGFFVDAKPGIVKDRLKQVEADIDTKSAADTEGNLIIVKIEPVLLTKDRLFKTKEIYEDEVMALLELFIASRWVDSGGQMSLAEVRLTYYVDGSFSVESGVPVEQSLVLPVQEEVVIVDAPPENAIYAGVS